MTDPRAERLRAFIAELKVMEEEAAQDDITLWGTAVGGAAQSNDLTNSPAYREIVTILHQTPLLVVPTMKWLKAKTAEMARAQLNALYTPGELAGMMKSVQS